MINKIYGISLSRLIATLMILSCHVFQFYGSQAAWWLNAGVNVFLIISGFLYGKKQYSFNSTKEFLQFSLKFYYKVFLKILLPLFLHILICIPLYYASGTEIIDLLKLFLLKNSGISGFGYMWYFKYILICYFLLPFYYLIPEKNYKNYIILILSIILLAFSKGTMIWYFCFVLGILIAKLHEKKYFLYFRIVIFLIAFTMTWICIDNQIDRVTLSYFLNIQKVTMGCSIVLLCLKIMENRALKPEIVDFFNYSDSISYSVFLVHPLFVSGCLSMLSITQYTALNIFICLFFVFFYAHFFNELVRRLLSNIIKQADSISLFKQSIKQKN